MDVGRILSSEGKAVDFPGMAKILFAGGPISGKISFYTLETKKTSFSC